MVALKLQQLQYDLKKKFLRRLVFPMLFGPSDGSLLTGGELQRGGISERGRCLCRMTELYTHIAKDTTKIQGQGSKHFSFHGTFYFVLQHMYTHATVTHTTHVVEPFCLGHPPISAPLKRGERNHGKASIDNVLHTW
jgi:hypothetical protein